MPPFVPSPPASSGATPVVSRRALRQAAQLAPAVPGAPVRQTAVRPPARPGEPRPDSVPTQVAPAVTGSSPVTPAPVPTPSGSGPAVGPSGPAAAPAHPFAPAAPVPAAPAAPNPADQTAVVPAPVAPFVPQRPDEPSLPHPPSGRPTHLGRPQAPSPETGWTPAVSGAVRRPVEPGTLPPGVIAPVPPAPPAGTFVPTGQTPVVGPSQLRPAEEGATPAWGSLGVSAEEVEEESASGPRGYTWLHMIVLLLGAFVAGVLVYLLLAQGRDPGVPQGMAETPDGSVAAALVDVPPGEL